LSRVVFMCLQLTQKWCNTEQQNFSRRPVSHVWAAASTESSAMRVFENIRKFE